MDQRGSTWIVRDHIPLEQGLRLGSYLKAHCLFGVRDHIPLEQGLRLSRVRDHIPLEQGLRPGSRYTSTYSLSSETIFH